MPIPTNLRKYIHTTPNPPHKGGAGGRHFFLEYKKLNSGVNGANF